MKAKDNPFNTERILKIRYFISPREFNGLFEKLRTLNYRCAIVGSEGAGKTTLMEDMEDSLCSMGFNIKKLLLTREKRVFPFDFINHFFKSLTPDDIILFDGAEQMNWLSWQIFKRKTHKSGGLIITSHIYGLLPTLYEAGTSPEILRDIVKLLLGEEVKKNEVSELYDRHRGNIREALRELYDIYARKIIS